MLRERRHSSLPFSRGRPAGKEAATAAAAVGQSFELIQSTTHGHLASLLLPFDPLSFQKGLFYRRRENIWAPPSKERWKRVLF